MRAPRAVAMAPPGRGKQRVRRRGPPALLVLVLLLSPALSPAQGGSTPDEAGAWPPEAWQRGDLEKLPLHHVAAILAGVTPDSPDGKQLKENLARLAAMPEPYPQVGEETLRGLGQAFWHQQQALRHLSPEERRLVTTADPAQPASDALQQALRRIDMEEVGRALAALDATSRATLAHLEESPPGLGAVLAEALGFPSDHGGTASLPAATPEQVVDLVALASGASLSPLERVEAVEALRDAPDEGIAALALVLDGLLPFAAGAPGDPAALVALGRGVEAAQPVLELWSAAATAHRLVQPVPLRIPDPDADRPDLRLGTSATPSTPGPAPDLAQALHELALLLGDDAAASQSDEVGQQLQDALPPEQVDALARTLAAVRAYILAQQHANHASVDPAQLHAWAEDLAAGDIPSPGTSEADALLAALPAMEALQAAESAKADLLAAVEDLVGDLAGPKQASHEPVHPCPPDIVAGFILAIDSCGTDSTWSDQYLLTIDVGGDDEYTHRAGAPFDSKVGLAQNLSVPISILVDTAGSDTYNTTEECTQGAACTDLVATLNLFDPTGVSATAPLSVLIDWSVEGTQTNNTFLAGSRSQGHASNVRATGILVERTGESSTLDSTYKAGDNSQGRANLLLRSGDSPMGLLLRVVGSNSTATSQFEAGSFSQGVATSPGAGGTSIGALVNLAGADATSNDKYSAKSNSQSHLVVNSGGSDSVGRDFGGMAILLDLAGPRSTSNDVYEAGASSRGHSQTIRSTPDRYAYMWSLALFLDAVVPHYEPKTSDVMPSTTGSGILLAPTVEFVAASDDTYRGLEGDMPNYGRGYGLFVDIGGTDDYEVAGVSSGGEWPANDHMWNDATSACSHRTAFFPACGMDLATHDDDGDAVPAIIEQVWTGFGTLWEADPSDAGKTPLPVPPAILVIPSTASPSGYAELLDAPYAAVLSLGSNGDTYGANFSAAVHIDLGGNDAYLGATAAASSVLTFGSGDDDPVGLGGGSKVNTPQRLLSFLLDVGGNDRYGDRGLSGVQGFGSAGAAGLLFDLDGDDHYVASHTAQGVGLHGGWGILVDATRATDDMNLFRAGLPSHGEGQDGGVGLLVATGWYNTFQDDPRMDDTADNGTGASINLGGANNARPQVGTPRVLLDGQEVTGALAAGQNYTFEAKVSDAHGDDLVVCWAFEHGEADEAAPMVAKTEWCEPVEGKIGDGSDRVAKATFVWNETQQARTVAPAQSIAYNVAVNATDPGGQTSNEGNKTVLVRNDPPVLGSIRGPPKVLAGQPAAFQVPFEPAHDMDFPKSVVDWDDGSPKLVSGSIDWAHRDRGATARLPEGVPTENGLQKPVLAKQPMNDPSQAIDGKTMWNSGSGPGSDSVWEQTALGFSLSNANPLAHLYIDFDTPHHIQRLQIIASATTNVQFSVEGVDEAGLPVPLDVVTIKPPVVPAHRNPEGFVEIHNITLPVDPRLQGLVLRQVAGEGVDGSVFIHEVRALGPGAIHTWDQPDTYDVQYTVVDEMGGRNTVSKNVTVEDSRALPSSFVPPLPVQAVDVAGRGVVHHVSIPSRPDGVLTDGVQVCGASVPPNQRFVFATKKTTGNLTVDWGDGSNVTADVGDIAIACNTAGQRLITFSHAWEMADDYIVTATFEGEGDPIEETVATMHVEDGFDLWSDQTPLMFFALGNATTTWHTDAAPYLSIVDRGGDDRYIGRLAVPRTPLPANTINEGALPSLVVDAAGNDDYLMTEVAPPLPGALGSPVGAGDMDVGMPLAPFQSNPVRWADCDNNNVFAAGDCVYVDADDSHDTSVGDLVLVHIPGSPVPAGGVLTTVSQTQRLTNPFRDGAFHPRYLDADGDGGFSRGDPVYLDDPASRGGGLGALTQGDIRVSGDRFGAMTGTDVPNVPQPSFADDDSPFTLCYVDDNDDGSFDPGEAAYLVVASSCTMVQPDDIHMTIPATPPPVQGMTQGFGYLGAAALLLDARGDDRYNAPGRAQGAAFKHGAGALIDLHGDDAFNVLAADHPDLLAGLPHHPVPWATWGGGRPPSLDAPRGALVPSTAELVQGAAEEGIGILLLHGGNDRLAAGDRSQGYGARNDVASAAHYAAPDPDCFAPPASAASQSQPGQPPTFTPSVSNWHGTLCLLGVGTGYEPTTGTDPGTGGPQGALGCTAGTLQTPASCNNSPNVLQGFLSNGPRMGPGTGLLLRTDGSTTYTAGDWSQGASDIAGRGGLLDLDGGFFASAGERAQGYTRDGTGVLWSSGQHTLWADGLAQACTETRGQGSTWGPEPAAMDRRVAVYAAPGREEPSSAGSCNKDNTQDVDLVDLSSTAPDIDWSDDALAWFAGDLENHVGDELVLGLDVSSDASSFEVVAYAQPYGEWDQTACTGAPLSGPVQLPHETIDAGQATIELDFITLLTDGPALPAGCQRIRVLARGVHEGVGVTAWSKLEGELVALPRPSVAVDAPVMVTNGAPVTFNAVIGQPLARPGGDATPEVQFFLRDGSDADQEAAFSSLGVWSVMPRGAGARQAFQLTDLPPSGSYDLTAQARWAGSGDYGDEIVVAQVIVDTSPPHVTMDAMERWWKGGKDIRLSGNVTDLGNEVEQVQVRLLRATCAEGPDPEADCVVQVKPPSLLVDNICAPPGSAADLHKCVVAVIDPAQQPPTCPPDLCRPEGFPDSNAFKAALHRSAAGGWIWETLPRIELSDFAGGRLYVQVNASDDGGASTGWKYLSEEGDPVDLPGASWVGVDRMPPNATSDQEAVATYQTFYPEPMNFTLSFKDCSVDPTTQGGSCISGSGVDEQSLVILVRKPDGKMAPLTAAEARADPADPDTVHINFTWQGPSPTPGNESGPEEGTYELLVQARDRAGNFLSINPGIPLLIDRLAPFVSSPAEVALPPGQQWIKPGDVLDVTVDAVDIGDKATGVANVTARLGTEAVALQPLQPGSARYSGKLNVTDLADGELARVAVTARDAADNPETVWSQGVLFYHDPPSVLDLQSEVRAQTILVDWRTDRAATVTAAWVEAEGKRIDGDIVPGPLLHSVRFLGLEEGTPYHLNVTMQDAAGHTQSIELDLETPLTSDAALVPDRPPAITRSGDIAIEGTVVRPVVSTLSLYLGSPKGQPLDTLEVEQSASDLRFRFDVDSTTAVLDSLDGAVPARFVLVLDDRVLAIERDVELRIDNAKPVLEPHVEGAGASNGWYNRSIIVDAGSSDDTAPLTHRVELAGVWQARRSVSVTQDGIHDLIFEAQDAAFPPNHETAAITVHVDRTLPRLEAGLDLPYPATRDPVVGLNVSSSDAMSGVAAHRLRVHGGAWDPWSDAVPTQALLDPGEGEQWVDIEVRDAAGNVQQRSLSILHDRTPPALLHAQWIGWSAQGDAVLQVIAQDRIGDDSRAAGIEAVRFAPAIGEPWASWILTDGQDALSVPDELAEADDGLLVQFIDRAGNLGPAISVPRAEAAPAAPAATVPPPAAGRIQSAAFAPTLGDTRTLFGFSAVVTPWENITPDAVWLEIAGQKHPMEPRGTPLDDGARLYTVPVRLDATLFDQPHRYRVVASFGDVTIASDEMPGPTVASAGIGGESVAGSGRDAPGPALVLLLVGLILMLRTSRRKDP